MDIDDVFYNKKLIGISFEGQSAAIGNNNPFLNKVGWSNKYHIILIALSFNLKNQLTFHTYDVHKKNYTDI